ncbi:MAG: nitroreductase family protein [Armatimonadota bacterium]|nr:nitroreductase family protein [Armatimonadota bacterium]
MGECSATLLDLLSRRRTVRLYTSDPVPEGHVRRLLEAAVLAPSAHNAQPWRFVVIETPEVKRRLAEAMAKRWERDLRRDGVDERTIAVELRFSLRRFTEAPILLLACLDMRDMDVYPDRARRKAEWIMGVQSVAAAIQNSLLAAAALGLGACWCCAPLFCPGTVRRVLKIPRRWEPQALITVGYPAHQPPVPPRYPLEEVVIWR